MIPYSQRDVDRVIIRITMTRRIVEHCDLDLPRDWHIQHAAGNFIRTLLNLGLL